ncbi:hypothetical protein [Streptomyces sp. NPDC059176]|uniref:hypothetical protein n=1 Tax=Streptomyces sp. NPDC059176 TaxID=3346758 RepID=UPI0036776B1B
MGKKEAAARAAVAAGTAALRAVGTYGLGSREAQKACDTADMAISAAEALGCTKADFKAAGRR